MKKIARGEIFKAFYDDEYIYVDKTKEIYSLIDFNHVFFSRPRRFGKSTVLDTIATLFEKGVEPYFKNTWIYDKWSEKTYPVLRLNFLKFSTNSFETFSKDFFKTLNRFTKNNKLSIDLTLEEPYQCLIDLFSYLNLNNKKIVILIDEYDCQLTANINNSELYDKFQQCFRSLYGALKGEPSIKFLGITGVTRLKDVTIFSVGSDINDATYEHRIATITGFTRDEIKKYYIDYLNLTASIQNKISIDQVTAKQREDILDQLAKEYNGYCFDSFNEIKVFSTWSVNKFFNSIQHDLRIVFGNYWFENGGLPSILKKYIESHNLSNIQEYSKDFITINNDDFLNPQSLQTMNQNVLMCQTGYLTLHSQIPNRMGIQLAIPNNEIRRSLSSLLATKIFKNTLILDENETKFFSNCSIDEMVNKFNLLLNTISYERYPITNESTFKMCLHISFLASSQPILVEQENSKGRADIILNYENRRIVLELKYAIGEELAQKKLEEAIIQMRERDYGNVLPKKLELLRIALVFDGEQRKITHYAQVK